MRIHTDKITAQDIRRLAPDGTTPEIVQHGSRKRLRAFRVTLSTAGGTDRHGNKRCYARRTGQPGSAGETARAATWLEWGDLVAALYKLDPDAIISPYAGVDDFLRQTARVKAWRPEKYGLGAGNASPWASEFIDLV